MLLNALAPLVAAPTRHLFFTGKGGVGKTSIACATAVALADAGKRVLLVSTDPASNLDEVLGVRLGPTPIEVPGVANLCALNLDPEEAARAYRERIVGPYRGILPDASVASIEEQLSGACTVEIAAFDEFAKLLGDASQTAQFDHVIFDTAPSGHTLRLLELPAAWTDFLGKSAHGASCLGPLSGLQAQQSLYAATRAALADAALTTIILVSRPDRSALAEADRTRGELAGIGVSNQRMILNGVFSSGDGDAVAQALAKRGADAVATMPAALATLARIEVPLLPFALVGVAAIRGRAPANESKRPAVAPRPLSGLIDELRRAERGVIMTMGKGGVGKTTTAAAIAVELARLGHRVTLTTTDPAAHVAAATDGAVPNLTVTRIDPAQETADYVAEVLATAGRDLDEPGRALLEEDLRSPCTEEIAVFRAFARTVDEGRNGFVVMDTAPTGHTLLLLDAAEAYHREVSRSLAELPDGVRQLLPRLRDPAFTRVLLVTLPEATPVHEASRLQDDLARAGITPYAWVINQSLAAAGVSAPVLAARAQLEPQYIAEVEAKGATRMALIPWRAEQPIGAEALHRFAHAGAWRSNE